MTPELKNFVAFLSTLENKTLTQIAQACSDKIRTIELSNKPDRMLIEHIRSVIMLIRYLHKPPVAKDEKIRQLLIGFFTRVQQNDPRAKHPLEVLHKMATTQPLGTTSPHPKK